MAECTCALEICSEIKNSHSRCFQQLLEANVIGTDISRENPMTPKEQIKINRQRGDIDWKVKNKSITIEVRLVLSIP